MEQLVETKHQEWTSSIQEWKRGWSKIALSYIAVATVNGFRLLYGQIEFGTEIDLGGIEPIRHPSRRVIAGRLLLETEASFMHVLYDALRGTVHTPTPFQMMSKTGEPAFAHFEDDREDARDGIQLVKSLYLDGFNKDELSRQGISHSKISADVQSMDAFTDLPDLCSVLGMHSSLLERGSCILVLARSPGKIDSAILGDDGTIRVTFSTARSVGSAGLKFSYVQRKDGKVIGRHSAQDLQQSENKRPGGGSEFTVAFLSQGADTVDLNLSVDGIRLVNHRFRPVPPWRPPRPVALGAPMPQPAAKPKKKGPRVFETATDVYTQAGTPTGEGGSGRVFQVKDSDGKPWAVKMIKPDVITTDKIKRFRNELDFCRRSTHDAIVRVHDSGFSMEEGKDGQVKCPFYVMDFYGKTLRDVIKARTPARTAYRYWHDVLRALAEAHSRKIYHRDLKPENILIDEAREAAVLADFGVAHFSDDEEATEVGTRTAAWLGNHRYAAPEQKNNSERATAPADIYAMGLMLNEIVTGNRPDGGNFPKIEAFMPEWAALDAVVERMREWRPSDRYQSMKAVEGAITEAVPALAVKV